MRRRPEPQPNRAGWAALAAATALAAAPALLFARVRIEGESMSPTLLPGDRVLVARVTGRLRVGDLVVVCDPRQRSRRVVKRVVAISPGAIEVRGDNPAASTDSRHFGPVPLALVRGVLLYRYQPSGAAGRIPRGGSGVEAGPRGPIWPRSFTRPSDLSGDQPRRDPPGREN